MSSTYTAWNGEEYPWPPPTDWYKASDEKWWAPGTGPGPATQTPDRTAAGPGATSQPAQQAPFNSTPQNLGGQNPSGQASFGSAPQQNFGGQNPPGQASFGSAPQQNFGANQGFGGGSSYQSNNSGNGKIFAGIAAAVGLLVLAGGIAFFTLRDDGGTASDETTTTTTAPTTTAAPTTTTTTAPTTTTTPPPDPAVATQQFRTYLSSKGITSDGVDDAALAGIAREYCVEARATSDRAQWDAYVRTQDSEFANLDSAEVVEFISGAIFHFCPAEAQRLGVTLP